MPTRGRGSTTLSPIPFQPAKQKTRLKRVPPPPRLRRGMYVVFLGDSHARGVFDVAGRASLGVHNLSQNGATTEDLARQTDMLERWGLHPSRVVAFVSIGTNDRSRATMNPRAILEALMRVKTLAGRLIYLVPPVCMNAPNQRTARADTVTAARDVAAAVNVQTWIDAVVSINPLEVNELLPVHRSALQTSPRNRCKDALHLQDQVSFRIAVAVAELVASFDAMPPYLPSLYELA